MTKTSRVPLIAVLLIGVLWPPACTSSQQRPAIADQIAKAHGLDSFGQVDAIRYTFNIDAGALKLSRSWVWEPKRGQISYEGMDKAGNPLKVTYSRSQPDSQTEVVKNEVDPAFFNDQYNLLFPFHLVWDTGATVQDAGMEKLPLGEGSARKVVVKYSSDGGYTPGDTWNLFVDPEGRIQVLHFQHGGSTKPSIFIAAYTEYRKAGPVVIALDHRGTADGNPARVFFTNVAVKLAGSDTWVDAK